MRWRRPPPRQKIGAFAEISSASSDVEIWHRMGDCGYLDKEGRLWFCGRKAERVQTATGDVFTEPCDTFSAIIPRLPVAL